MNIKSLSGSRTLSLTNSGELSVFFLGVGSAFTKAHYQNNILIIKGKDHVLVDCGTKTPQALHELGVNVMDIEHLIITHSHADHIGGLEELILMHRYVKQQKPTIHISAEYQHILWDMSLKGGAAFNEEHNGEPLSFGDLFTIVRPSCAAQYPRQTLETDIGSINIKMFRTMHIPDDPASWRCSFWSCGLIIDDRVMFTSDTRFDINLLTDYASRFDLELIFHDCQFYPGGVHAPFEELKTLPGELKKKMVLMHYGDNWKDYEKAVKREGFAGLAQQWKYYLF
ncbi:MAG: MBL fold metallo-hydrolase [Spirochaetales bacterium]|nr:MBL fold metallo-hydrolase [Spirochaetales bacterium]